jgi:hypothetical protein
MTVRLGCPPRSAERQWTRPAAHSAGIPTATRSATAPARREVGAVTLEFAFAAVVAMVLFLVLVLVAVWYHTRGVALTAAQDGARAAAVLGGNPEAGQRRARALLETGLGPTAAQQAVVLVERGTDRSRATVRVPLAPLLPLPGNLSVDVTDEQLTERFRPHVEAGGS